MMKKKGILLNTKKRSLLFIMIGLLLLTGGIYAHQKSTRTTGAGTGKIVIIDPGHGGQDPGKIGVNDALEKDLNLAIAKQLAAYLYANGYTVIMTRTDDIMLNEPDASNKKTSDLNARIAIFEESHADFVISIHQNSYPDASICGAQCFYYQGSEEGKELALKIQNAIVKLTAPDNHRQAKSNDTYYIMKNSSCPVVIVECGFLSNYEEAALLADKNYQKKLAFAITTGVNEFVNSQY